MPFGAARFCVPITTLCLLGTCHANADDRDIDLAIAKHRVIVGNDEKTVELKSTDGACSVSF